MYNQNPKCKSITDRPQKGRLEQEKDRPRRDPPIDATRTTIVFVELDGPGFEIE